MIVPNKSQAVIVSAFQDESKSTSEKIIDILSHDEVEPLVNHSYQMAECVMSRINIQLALQNYREED